MARSERRTAIVPFVCVAIALAVTAVADDKEPRRRDPFNSDIAIPAKQERWGHLRESLRRNFEARLSETEKIAHAMTEAFDECACLKVRWRSCTT